VVTHNEFVVILAEDEEKRIRSHLVSGIAQGDASAPLPTCPDVSTSALLTKLQRTVNDSQMRVNFQRARLYTERFRLT
jgi:hypothetical protein